MNTANITNTATAVDTTTTHEVLLDRLPELQAKVEKFNKKANRLGLEGMTLRQIGQRVVELDEGLFVQVRAIVELSGKAPTVAGYTFVAKIEHTQGKNLVWKAPGQVEDLPVEFRDAPPTCDHCKTNRRRNDTFVLRDTTGQFIRIGRSCLADFLRTDDASAALNILSFAQELEVFFREEGDGGRSSEYISLSRFLACTARAVEVWGWVSRREAEIKVIESTAHAALFLSRQCAPQATQYPAWLKNQPTERDCMEADKVIGFVDSMEASSDYAHNLKTVFGLGYVSVKHAGLVASAVAAYRRHQEEVIARASRPESNHFGVVGKQYLRTLLVLGVRSWDSQWGTTYLYLLQDSSGNKFKWFASRKCRHPQEDFRGIDTGDEISFAFTIKSHGDYQGVKETVVTRATACKTTEGLKWVHPTTGEIFKSKKALSAAV